MAVLVCLEALFSAQGIQDEALRDTLGSLGANSQRLAVVLDFFFGRPLYSTLITLSSLLSAGAWHATHQPLTTSNGRNDKNKKETSALAMKWYHQRSAFYSCVGFCFVCWVGFGDEK